MVYMNNYKKQYKKVMDKYFETKLSRVKIQKRYDKNNDKFITIDEYLAEEISKGPKTDPGSISYHYQDYANVFNYFLILLNDYEEFNILCMPRFALQNGNVLIRTSIAYYIKENVLQIPAKVDEEIKKCRQNDRIRFIYFTLIIVTKSIEKLTHANILLIDLKKETMERFEPFGHSIVKNEKQIDSLIKQQLFSVLGIQNFKYIAPVDISPLVGIQRKADAYCGMCVTIAMMYLHLRILNADVPQKKIISYLLKNPKKKLINKILKYARSVEKKLKNNTELVNFLNNELYSYLV